MGANRRILNVFVNGRDNVGEGPANARHQAREEGLIINGVILGRDREKLAAYLRLEVQTGAGSFVMAVQAKEDVTTALLAKFLMDLAAGVRASRDHPG